MSSGVGLIEADIGGLDGEPAPAGMASRAFTARLTTALRDMAGSALMFPAFARRIQHELTSSPITRRSIFSVSAMMAFTLSTLNE